MRALGAILRGTAPSSVLRAAIVARPWLTNGQIAQAFIEKFPLVQPLDAAHAIWNWERPGGERRGHTDQELDAILRRLLRAAGYPVVTEPDVVFGQSQDGARNRKEAQKSEQRAAAEAHGDTRVAGRGGRDEGE